MENVQFWKGDFNVIEDNNLNAYDFRVYTLLMKYYNVDKDMAYPSQRTIAEKLNISLSTVKKSIKRLTELEYIKVDKKKAIKGNYNTYKIKHIILSVKEAIRKGTKIFTQSAKKSKEVIKNEVVEPLREVANKVKEASAVTDATSIKNNKCSKQNHYNKTSYSSQQTTSYNSYKNNYNNNTKTLKFMNFDQRQYDYDKLEKQLLGWE